jgi:hypothetical protein
MLARHLKVDEASAEAAMRVAILKAEGIGLHRVSLTPRGVALPRPFYGCRCPNWNTAMLASVDLEQSSADVGEVKLRHDRAIHLSLPGNRPQRSPRL